MKDCMVIEYVKIETNMPGAPIPQIPEDITAKLNEILKGTYEFPFHTSQDDLFIYDKEIESEPPKAANVLHIVSLCMQFRKAFTASV